MTENKENLEELLSNFFERAEAPEIKRDIESGDEIFSNHPTLEPDEELINTIKSRISLELVRTRKLANLKKVLGRVAAVAAVIIAAALISMVFLSNGTDDGLPLAGDIWQDDILDQDPVLLALMTQVEEIADQIEQVRLDETGQEDDFEVSQWQIEELEMVANNTDFWKG
jgi:hypothetical protein